MTRRLTAEERRALAVLAASGRNGATLSLLGALDFGARLVTSLVEDGLATVAYEDVRAGGRWIEVAKVRITDAGRRALADGGAPDAV